MAKCCSGGTDCSKASLLFFSMWMIVLPDCHSTCTWAVWRGPFMDSYTSFTRILRKLQTRVLVVFVKYILQSRTVSTALLYLVDLNDNKPQHWGLWCMWGQMLPFPRHLLNKSNCLNQAEIINSNKSALLHCSAHGRFDWWGDAERRRDFGSTVEALLVAVRERGSCSGWQWRVWCLRWPGWWGSGYTEAGEPWCEAQFTEWFWQSLLLHFVCFYSTSQTFISSYQIQYRWDTIQMSDVWPRTLCNKEAGWLFFWLEEKCCDQNLWGLFPRWGLGVGQEQRK